MCVREGEGERRRVCGVQRRKGRERNTEREAEAGEVGHREWIEQKRKEEEGGRQKRMLE